MTKKGVGNPLYFGVENYGCVLAPELIIYENFLIGRPSNALRYIWLGVSAEAFNTPRRSQLFLGTVAESNFSAFYAWNPSSEIFGHGANLALIDELSIYTRASSRKGPRDVCPDNEERFIHRVLHDG